MDGSAETVRAKWEGNRLQSALVPNVGHREAGYGYRLYQQYTVLLE